MDVAAVGVEVTQKGVTATATALGKLAEQSVKVTTSVAALLISDLWAIFVSVVV